MTTTIQKFSKSEKSSESLIMMRKQTMENTLLNIALWLSLRTTPNMMENGFKERTSDKARVAKYGQTALCMKVGGKIIKLTEKEDLFMLTVMSTMVNGKMTRHMVTVSIAI